MLKSFFIPLDDSFADKNNYYSWTDEYPNTSHKFKIAQSISEHYKDYKDYSDEFNEEDNISHWSTDFYHSKSYFFDNSIEHKWYIYCKSQGLNLLRYSSIIQHNPISNSFVYNGLKDKTYNSLDDFLTHERIDIYKNQYTNEDEFITVLEQFDSNASHHIEKFNDFVCFLSLASNDSTEMVWGDYHKFEIFGFKSDFKQGNFSNLHTI